MKIFNTIKLASELKPGQKFVNQHNHICIVLADKKWNLPRVEVILSNGACYETLAAGQLVMELLED